MTIVNEGLLPFGHDKPAAVYHGPGHTMSAHTQRLFKPRGLMLWDAGSADLTMIRIGVCEQLICSWGPIPARWFSKWESFEAVAKAVDEGFEPPGWGSWDQVRVGEVVRLGFENFEGDFSKVRALMWGHYVGL